MQKLTSFIIFSFILSAACSAQTSNTSDSTFKIIDWNKITNAIFSSINEHQDSLRFSGIGTVFFRMKLRNGHFTDIKCSAKEPSLLISLVTDAFKDAGNKNGKFSFNRSDIKTVMRQLAGWDFSSCEVAFCSSVCSLLSYYQLPSLQFKGYLAFL